MDNFRKQFLKGFDSDVREGEVGEDIQYSWEDLRGGDIIFLQFLKIR